jgi:anthranilate phosphoribosyltransferase
MVVHGEDGLDELTLGADTLVWEVWDGAIRHYRVSPSDAGLGSALIKDFQGGDKVANARILREVCGGRFGPARDVVLLNAAAMLVVGDAVGDLSEGVEAARQAIDNGEATRCVDNLVSLSQRLAKESAPSL